MAKVLFVNPVVREEDVPRHIPYGISLLAAIAMEEGHEVQIYDANAWRKGFDVLEEVYRADDWDIIAIGGLTTTYGFVKKACKLAKEVAPKSILACGGGVITSMPYDIMEWIPEIDIGVLGEAFVSFAQLLQGIDEGLESKISKIKGLAYRDNTGKVWLTGTAPLIKDLDALPYPAWDLLPIDIYFDNSQELASEELYTSKRRIDLNGSLGCSLVCRYCWHLGITGDMVIEEIDGRQDVKFSYGRTVRYHSPRYIVDMTKELVKRYDIDFVSFIDENMMTMDAFSKRTWIRELCKLWIEEGLQPTCRRDGVPHDENCTGVHFGGTSHATLATDEALEWMYKAGCSYLIYGIESLDPIILKNLGKATTQKKNYDAIAQCVRHGIRPIPNFIIGFPEESFQSIRHMIDGLRRLNIHCKPHFATAYPGSEWYYTYKNAIIEQYDGDLEQYILDLGDASDISATISHKFTAMDLMALQEIIHKRDLRLLDLAEAQWEKTAADRKDVVEPQVQLNFERKKIKAPSESKARPQGEKFSNAEGFA